MRQPCACSAGIRRTRAARRCRAHGRRRTPARSSNTQRNIHRLTGTVMPLTVKRPCTHAPSTSMRRPLALARSPAPRARKDEEFAAHGDVGGRRLRQPVADPRNAAGAGRPAAATARRAKAAGSRPASSGRAGPAGCVGYRRQDATAERGDHGIGQVHRLPRVGSEKHVRHAGVRRYSGPRPAGRAVITRFR